MSNVWLIPFSVSSPSLSVFACLLSGSSPLWDCFRFRPPSLSDRPPDRFRKPLLLGYRWKQITRSASPTPQKFKYSTHLLQALEQSSPDDLTYFYPATKGFAGRLKARLNKSINGPHHPPEGIQDGDAALFGTPEITQQGNGPELLQKAQLHRPTGKPTSRGRKASCLCSHSKTQDGDDLP